MDLGVGVMPAASALSHSRSRCADQEEQCMWKPPGHMHPTLQPHPPSSASVLFCRDARAHPFSSGCFRGHRPLRTTRFSPATATTCRQ